MSHDMFLLDDEPDRPSIQSRMRTSGAGVLEWDNNTTEYPRPDWFADAACAGCTNLFYPEQGESVAEAKRLCRACPVRKPCLEYALEIGEKFGIWGGFSERERRRMRALRNRRAGKPSNGGRPTQPWQHGTDGGYSRHLRDGIPACVACLQAHSLARQIRVEAARP